MLELLEERIVGSVGHLARVVAVVHERVVFAVQRAFGFVGYSVEQEGCLGGWHIWRVVVLEWLVPVLLLLLGVGQGLLRLVLREGNVDLLDAHLVWLSGCLNVVVREIDDLLGDLLVEAELLRQGHVDLLGLLLLLGVVGRVAGGVAHCL